MVIHWWNPLFWLVHRRIRQYSELACDAWVVRTFPSQRRSYAEALIDVVERHFRAAGLSVRHDDPYRGGWTTGHYGRPDEGVHAIQIELNRALYVDEPSSRPKDAELSWLRDLAGTLLDRLAQIDLSRR